MALADYSAQVGTYLMGPGQDVEIEKVDGFGPPDMRTGEVAKPMADGEFLGLDFFGPRVLTITANVFGDTDDAVTQNLDTLVAAWRTVPMAADAVVPLVLKLPGWIGERQLNGRPRRINVATEMLHAGVLPVVLEYFSPDPVWYDAHADSVTLSLANPLAGRTYPRTYPVAYAPGGSGTVGALNQGNMSARPVIRINGPVVGPQLENVNAGRILHLAISIAAGDYLDVDVENRTILLDGTASRYSTLTNESSWWDLAPGTSSLAYRADSFTPGASAVVTWRNAWL